MDALAAGKPAVIWPLARERPSFKYMVAGSTQERFDKMAARIYGPNPLAQK